MAKPRVATQNCNSIDWSGTVIVPRQPLLVDDLGLAPQPMSYLNSF